MTSLRRGVVGYDSGFDSACDRMSLRREHSMTRLTAVLRGSHSPLRWQGLARFPQSRSSTSWSGQRVHQASRVPGLLR
jgi:hypothetical protein